MEIMSFVLLVGSSLDTDVSDGEKIGRLCVGSCPVIQTCRVCNV